MILNEDFDLKNRTFWIFGSGEGNKIMLGVWIDEFCTKTTKSCSVT